MKNNFSIGRLHDLLRQIPDDKVTTYSEIARALGSPRAQRAAGSLLAKNHDPDRFPCFRVVRSDGHIGQYQGGVAEKIRRLQSAGIMVANGKIVDFAQRMYVFKKIAV